MAMDRRIKSVDGKVIDVIYIPNEAMREQNRFARMLNKMGSWMPETNMKQIMSSYNEAFEQVYM